MTRSRRRGEACTRLFGTALAAVAFAGIALAGEASAPPPPPTSPVVPARTEGAPPARVPNADLIEFLGEDDVPKPSWWEFIQRRAPEPPRAPARGGSQP